MGRDDFMITLDLATKVKAAMRAKGKRQGRTKCPRRGGKITAILAGSRDHIHIHMACETPNCIRMME